MKQQINLYAPVFRPQKVSWSAGSLIKLTVLMVLLLGAASAYGYYRTAQLASEQQQLESRNQEIQTQLETISAQSTQKNQTETLEERLKSLKEKRNLSRKALALLKNQTDEMPAPMSKFFLALARQTITGIWLNSIVIQQGGETIMLAGKTYSPDLLPIFIETLRSETAFSGTAFQSLSIQRSSSTADNTVLDFQMRTKNTNLESSTNE